MGRGQDRCDDHAAPAPRRLGRARGPTDRRREVFALDQNGPPVSRPPALVLRLYIAGSTPTSILARSNLKAILAGLRYRLDTVDVMCEPSRALDDGVLATPTLLRIAPQPVIKIVGTLDCCDVVRRALGSPPGV